MGAWIEIIKTRYVFKKSGVAPLVGAWIEISLISCIAFLSFVAPLVGAWIEIEYLEEVQAAFLRRSSRGSVD